MGFVLSDWKFIYNSLTFIHVVFGLIAQFIFIYQCLNKKGSETHIKWGRYYLNNVSVAILTGLLLAAVSAIAPEIHLPKTAIQVYFIQYTSAALFIASISTFVNLKFNMFAEKGNPGWRGNLIINSFNLVFVFGNLYLFFNYGKKLYWFAMMLPSFYPFIRQVECWYLVNKKGALPIQSHIQAAFTTGILQVVIYFFGAPSRYIPFIKDQVLNPVVWVAPILVGFALEKLYLSKIGTKLYEKAKP